MGQLHAPDEVISDRWRSSLSHTSERSSLRFTRRTHRGHFRADLLPLLYAWVRIRPMDDSEPDTVLGMDAKRLALVTVSLALGAVVFVILVGLPNPPTTESAIAIGSRTMVGTRRCPSTRSTLPRHGSCPVLRSLRHVCGDGQRSHPQTREEGGGELLWAPVHRRLVVVVHHRECGLLGACGRC